MSKLKRTLEEVDHSKRPQLDRQDVPEEYDQQEPMSSGLQPASKIHLNQIQRSNLDFDMEKVCSITLWPKSVFCCLVCGRFFQGKAKGSHLYLHCLQAGHFVAMSLSSGTIYSMPDGKVIEDPSLDDIRYCLRPKFSQSDLEYFRTKVTTIADHKAALRDLHGSRYLPGLLGLNDLSTTDGQNSVVQALVRIRALREYFLTSNWEQSESRVTRAFGELVCQMFSSKRFKNTISPNEFIQAVSSASQGKFHPGTRIDAKEFLVWLLFELHKGCGGTKKPMSSIVHECFLGEVRVESTVVELKRDFSEAEQRSAGPSLASNGHAFGNPRPVEPLMQVTTNKVDFVPFTLLSLDLPTNPVFTDSIEGETTIPHITLLEVLDKYNGVKSMDVNLPGGRLEQKRYIITKLPMYLVFHLNRFHRTEMFTEKNRAVVTLPLGDLDLQPFVVTSNAVNVSKPYQLFSSVCHDGGVGPGVRNAISHGHYKANVYYPPKDAWYEMDNLSVRQVDMPHLVAVAETYLAFYERGS